MEHSNREKIKKIKTSQSRKMLSRKDNKSKPCEADVFCPRRIYHPMYSYTSSRHILEDQHEGCKKDCQEEMWQEAPRAGKQRWKVEENQRKEIEQILIRVIQQKFLKLKKKKKLLSEGMHCIVLPANIDRNYSKVNEF